MKCLVRMLFAVAIASCFVSDRPVRSQPQPVEPEIDFVAAPGSPISVGPMAGRPAVGDCNGDGNPDIVLACGTC